MGDFLGDLLIGGARIKNVHGELQRQTPIPNSHDWMLAGQLHLSRSEGEQLETYRTYRLRLSDGREAQVVVSRCEHDGGGDEFIADFEPALAKAVAMSVGH